MADPTLTYQTQFSSAFGQPEPEMLTALILLWSLDEPERVGEVLLIPSGSPGPVKVYGREAPGQLATEDRVRLARQRPGQLEPLGLTRSLRISRKQLSLRCLKDGSLEVINQGRCALLHNGVKTNNARVSVGDTIELKEQQVFLCIRRTSWMESLPENITIPLHGFGEADRHGIVGESPAIWKTRSQISFAAARQTHVLIHGASGTGKELVAKGLHALSGRGHRPLVARNAATFPEGLIDAELFGNAKGFPNPGMKERPGLIGEADGSTLFLDEFGELPSEMQAHLLRVMDEGEYQRLGESNTRRSEFRLVAATNRPLEQLKHDVAARLKIRLFLSDLNARREDIPLLARHLLRHIAIQDPAIAKRFFQGGSVGGEARLSPALISALARHHYTTHIRELEGFIWEAMANSSRDYLDITPGMHFIFEVPSEDHTASTESVDPTSIDPEVLRESLERNEWVQARVWKELGLKNRFVLRRLMKKHKIELPQP